MSGRIVLVDTIATHRIIMRAKLRIAGQQVETCDSYADALDIVKSHSPDLVIVAFSETAGPTSDPAHRLIGRLRHDPTTALIPVIATGRMEEDSLRLAAFRAGADALLDWPCNDALLQAMIRSLLRSAETARELSLRDDTRHALGFAEAPATFMHSTDLSPAGTVAIIDAGETWPMSAGRSKPPEVVGSLGGKSQANSLRALLPESCTLIDLPRIDTSLPVMPDEGHSNARPNEDNSRQGALPDLFIVNGSGCTAAQVFCHVADLRARARSRHTAIMVVLAASAADSAAMVLDLGAEDVIARPVCAAEMAHRIRALLRRKMQRDRLRDTLRHGLEAAVTDQLTGLYNRRYAVPHLERIATRAQASGRRFALMLLDIDHFKAINDSHGHTTGDAVLIGVAQRLRDNLRPADLIARIGGEEFLIAMPDTNLAQAKGAAERLRRVIEGEPFPGSFTAAATAPIPVTLSIGVAMSASLTDQFRPRDVAAMHGVTHRLSCLDAALHDRRAMPQDVPSQSGGWPEIVAPVYEQADAALYAAKSAGRNMVGVWPDAA